IGAYYYLRIVFYMYFGEEREEGLNGGKSVILSAMLLGSAAVMVFGIVNMFGVEGAAAMAAQTLVN
ncbi:MAG: NADH-quinone oxidoreductase subunit N, partial [Tateyamaria sp.]